MRTPLPVPVIDRMPLIDPYRDRTSYRRFLSELYHAEAAAMHGFALMTDPKFVQSSEIFKKASTKLVADEQSHLKDIEQMIALLEDGGLLPADETTQEFWGAWYSGRIYALPLPPSIAAMLVLFAEGLGYSILYNLAHATLDPAIRALLFSNLKDEEGHLRISMTVLKRALEREPNFALDFSIYAFGFALLARKPARKQRPVFEAVGFDFNDLFGGGLRFVRDLFISVLHSLNRTKAARVLLSPVSDFICSAQGIRLLFPLSYVPDPPLARQAVLAWGKASAWKSRAAHKMGRASAGQSRPADREFTLTDSGN